MCISTLWVAHWLEAWFVTWLFGARKNRPQQRASLGKAASTGRIRRGPLSDFCMRLGPTNKAAAQ